MAASTARHEVLTSSVHPKRLRRRVVSFFLMFQSMERSSQHHHCFYGLHLWFSMQNISIYMYGIVERDMKEKRGVLGALLRCHIYFKYAERRCWDELRIVRSLLIRSIFHQTTKRALWRQNLQRRRWFAWEHLWYFWTYLYLF